MAKIDDRPYTEGMSNQAATSHFEHVALGNALGLKQREREYARLSPYERIALGLTLYAQQAALKHAMIGSQELAPARRTAPFSIKALYEAAQRRS